MKKIFSIFFLLISFQVFAQKGALEKADLYYEYFRFKEAAVEYEIALSTAGPKTEAYILQRLAESYMYTFQYAKAEQYFDKLVRLGDGKTPPDAYLNFGNILKINGNYTRARDQFSYYKTLIPDDPYADMLLRSVNWAIKHQDSSRMVYVGLTNLDISGQSLGHAFFDEGLIYAKAKPGQSENETQIFNLSYAHRKDSLTFEDGEPIVEDLVFQFNESSPYVSFESSRNILYFSANATKLKKQQTKKPGKAQESQDGVTNLKVYVSVMDNGRFSFSKELPFNNKEYNCTQPCLSEDGKVLFFASDMPGGYGGLDLYRVERLNDGTWGPPQNLGDKVNTTEHEMYPYAKQGYLYFSSKGHVGFGGYDIFQAKLSPNNLPSGPVNLGKPFNSSRDDMAFIILNDGITGYFASNKDNAEGIDKVYYFRDLYESHYPAAPVIAATPKDSPVIAAAPSTNPVIKGAEEKIGGVKPGTTTATTTPDKTATAAKETMASESDEDLLKKVFRKVYFKFNDASVPGEAIVTLDSAIAAVKKNHRIKVQVNAHTDCRGSEAYNKSLSVKRALAVRQYLLAKGVRTQQIVLIGWGETKPVAACDVCETCSVETHQANRRVEIKLIK